MTAPFTYPTVDYHTRTPAQERYSALRTRLQALVASLDAAKKSEKRSPKKWTPIVARLTDDVARTQAEFDEAEALQSAEYEAHRAERKAIIDEAKVWALEQLGGRVFRLPETDYPAIRIAVADNDEVEILAWGTERSNFEVAYVKAGTIERVNRSWADVYVNGPEEKWSRVSDPMVVEPATLRWSSESEMSPESARLWISIYGLGVMVAEKINEAFGL